jgi:hypothetical protein
MSAVAPLNAKADILSLKHLVMSEKAIVTAQKEYRKISFGFGMGASYSAAYLAALKSGRKRPSLITVNEQPSSYDFTSNFTLTPSRDLLVTHSNELFKDNHFRDTTTISYENQFIGNDVNSTIQLSYDSNLDAAIFETRSVMISPIADLGYTIKNGKPAAVFISNDFESNFGNIDLNYIPGAKYDIQNSDYYFLNDFEALIRLKPVDFELGLHEVLKRQSGSFYSRSIIISSGNSAFGVTSRNLETDTWRNGSTFYLKNGIKLNDGPPDFSIRTSYSLSNDSEEKKFYVEFIWE